VDHDLVSRAQRGDESAFAEIAYGMGDRLFTVAQRILRDVDLAEDATQQAIVAIWRELSPRGASMDSSRRYPDAPIVPAAHRQLVAAVKVCDIAGRTMRGCLVAGRSGLDAHAPEAQSKDPRLA